MKRITIERAAEIQAELTKMSEWTCTDNIKQIVQDLIDEVNTLSEVVVTLHSEVRRLKGELNEKGTEKQNL